ncbi:hypothetical protein CL619_03350 [archaeon]|nr:hypothetical protein [archaeon]|tara:strand:+ start:2686 stop:3372 length:687 start_codon:yes stop_codon:yes gene_type:complete
MLFAKDHLIHNFPKRYPLYKKIFANFIYVLGGIVIHHRKNSLTHKDIFRAKHRMYKGDIVLVGNLRELSSLAISGITTHAMLYLGRRRFVGAVGDGVSLSTWHHVATEYDVLIILRIPRYVKGRRRMIQEACLFAEKQLGKPYDFFFESDYAKYFCTELVNSAFHHAKFHTGLSSVKPSHNVLEKIEKKIFSGTQALKPDKFLTSNFDIVFISHNLEYKDGKLHLNED